MSLLDDIVFAKRNKEYGAYQLRKRYKRHLLYAVIISLVLTGIVITYAIYDLTFKSNSSLYEILNDSTGIIEFTNFDLAPIPVEPQNDPHVTGMNEASVEVAKVTSDEFGIDDEKTEEMVDEMINKMQENISQDLAEDIEQTTNQYDENHSHDIRYDINGPIKARETDLRRYILNNTKYPDSALNNKLNGLVLVQFILSRKGEITNISLLKKAYPVLDREAVRVVRSIPRDKPVLVKGKPVAVMYKIPIVFKFNK